VSVEESVLPIWLSLLGDQMKAKTTVLVIGAGPSGLFARQRTRPSRSERAARRGGRCSPHRQATRPRQSQPGTPPEILGLYRPAARPFPGRAAEHVRRKPDITGPGYVRASLPRLFEGIDCRCEFPLQPAAVREPSGFSRPISHRWAVRSSVGSRRRKMEPEYERCFWSNSRARGTARLRRFTQALSLVRGGAQQRSRRGLDG